MFPCLRHACPTARPRTWLCEKLPPASTPTTVPAQEGGKVGNALEMYDDNGNGRITCAEARKHGIAPVRRGHPAYQYRCPVLQLTVSSSRALSRLTSAIAIL